MILNIITHNIVTALNAHPYYVCEDWRLFFSTPRTTDIGPDLLKLFDCITAVRIFKHSAHSNRISLL